MRFSAVLVIIELIFMLFSSTTVVAAANAPFPKWSKDVTGFERWPVDGIPPYIGQRHHHPDRLPNIPPRVQGECGWYSKGACSFDCSHCTRKGDVLSCDSLSQTFDDGPTEFTPSSLKALKKLKIHTTFFSIGSNVVAHPNVVRKEREDGHVVGVHTWSHRYLPALSNSEVYAELQWCIWAINVTASVVPRYFRPPYGGVDDRIRAIAAQLGLVTVLWDRDTNDWQLTTGQIGTYDISQTADDWISSSLSHKDQGLILEHDLLPENVQVAREIASRIKNKQKTVAQCCNGAKYQKS